MKAATAAFIIVACAVLVTLIALGATVAVRSAANASASSPLISCQPLTLASNEQTFSPTSVNSTATSLILSGFQAHISAADAPRLGAVVSVTVNGIQAQCELRSTNVFVTSTLPCSNTPMPLKLSRVLVLTSENTVIGSVMGVSPLRVKDDTSALGDVLRDLPASERPLKYVSAVLDALHRTHANSVVWRLKISDTATPAVLQLGLRACKGGLGRQTFNDSTVLLPTLPHASAPALSVRYAFYILPVINNTVLKSAIVSTSIQKTLIPQKHMPTQFPWLLQFGSAPPLVVAQSEADVQPMPSSITDNDSCILLGMCAFRNMTLTFHVSSMTMSWE